jgi:hypothetical protein
VRRLLFFLLFLLAPVALGQALSPEIPLTRGEVAASPDQNRRPRIVRNGATTIVVWDAYSRTRWVALGANGAVTHEGSEEGLYFSDVAAAGDGFMILGSGYPEDIIVLLDRDGVERKRVGVGRGADETLAWNGSRVLIAGFTRTGYLLDANANVIAGPLTLPEPSPNAFVYTAAATESEFGVVMLGQTEAYLVRMSPDGAILGTIDLGVASQGPASYDRPAIATDGRSFFVAWRLNDSLRGAIVRDGAVTPTFTIAESGVTGWPHASWNGSSYAITYETLADIAEKHVSAAGAVGERETVAATPRDERYPDVLDDTVVFERDTPCSRTEAAIIAMRGGHETLLSTGVPAELTPAPAATPDTFFVAYRERSDLARIRTTFGDFPVPDVSQMGHAVATDGEGFLVVAVDVCGVVRAARFTSAGPGEAFEIGGNAQTSSPPFVMWNGSEFIALWENRDPSQVIAIPLDRDGRPLDGPRGLTPAIAQLGQYVSIASSNFTLVPNGGEYLLVWENFRYSDYPFYTDPPPTLEVKVRHITSSLHAAGEARVIANGYLPYAASNGTDTVVVWGRDRKLHAGRLTPNGELAGDQIAGDEHGAFDRTPVVPAGNDFVVAAGDLLARVNADGMPLWIATVSSQTSAFAWNGAMLRLFYERDQRVFERSVIDPLPRRRGVAH